MLQRCSTEIHTHICFDDAAHKTYLLDTQTLSDSHSLARSRTHTLCLSHTFTHTHAHAPSNMQIEMPMTLSHTHKHTPSLSRARKRVFNAIQDGTPMINNYLHLQHLQADAAAMLTPLRFTCMNIHAYVYLYIIYVYLFGHLEMYMYSGRCS